MATSDELSDAIASMTLFADLATPQLARVVHTFEERFFPEGERILRQGLRGSGFFVVVDGNVRVVRDGELLATLGPGEFFGELSILDGQPRIAQVVADEPTRCLALASWDFERILLEHPALTLGILRGLAGRLRAVTEQHRQ